MTKSKASVYLAGHDHCAEYLEAYDFAHHGCGAAHEYDPSTAHESAHASRRAPTLASSCQKIAS